jgi:hypothetical protein
VTHLRPQNHTSFWKTFLFLYAPLFIVLALLAQGCDGSPKPKATDAIKLDGSCAHATNGHGGSFGVCNREGRSYWCGGGECVPLTLPAPCAEKPNGQPTGAR